MYMKTYKQIPGYSNYEISDCGEVRNIKTKRVLKKRLFRNNYYRINLIGDDNKSHTLFIHRLVAITYLENPFNLEHIDHIDRNKKNNNKENLRWSTLKDNMNNRYFGDDINMSYCNETNTFIINDPAKNEMSRVINIDDAIEIFKGYLYR